MVAKPPNLVNQIAARRPVGYHGAAGQSARRERRLMKVLFLDESGDHNPRVVDPNYPVFILGGVIVDKEYADGPLTQAVDDFKRRMFGRTDIVLHTADITRVRNGFERLKDNEFRAHFYQELNGLMQELRYSVVACIVHKSTYFRLYGTHPSDPYRLSFDALVEIFCRDIGNVRNGGLIVAEKRQAALDQELQQHWFGLRNSGNRYVRGDVIRSRIQALDLRGKRENIAGLQLADLVVSPIGRHIVGKPDKGDWGIIERKLRRSRRGRTGGYGLVELK